jgi:hypothetical protein
MLVRLEFANAGGKPHDARTSLSLSRYSTAREAIENSFLEYLRAGQKHGSFHRLAKVPLAKGAIVRLAASSQPVPLLERLLYFPTQSGVPALPARPIVLPLSASAK